MLLFARKSELRAGMERPKVGGTAVRALFLRSRKLSPDMQAPKFGCSEVRRFASKSRYETVRMAVEKLSGNELKKLPPSETALRTGLLTPNVGGSADSCVPSI